MALVVLIPTTGRFVFNADINPDIHIGLITCCSTLIVLNSLFPLLTDTKRNLSFVIFFILGFATTIIVLLSSDVGFPFQYDATNPTTKRLEIFCAKRTFLNDNNDVTIADTVCKVHRLDYMWSGKLLEAVPEYKTKKHVPTSEECQTMIGCGFPDDWMTGFGFENQGWIINNYDLYIPKRNRVSLNKISAYRIDQKHFNLTMEINGPNDIFVKISTITGVKIESSGPMSITKGSESKFRIFRKPKNLLPIMFWLVVSGWKDENGLMQVVVGGRSWSHKIKQGDNEFVDNHPQWVTPYVYVFDYKYYNF